MMNLNEPAQRLLWELADEIYRTEGVEARKAMDSELMVAGRKVLKTEWDRIKAELVGN
jgi:hypothetical protein